MRIIEELRRVTDSVPGDWACTSCQMNNFRWREECYGCKLGRHEKAPVKKFSPQELEAHSRKIKEKINREAEERKKRQNGRRRRRRGYGGKMK